MTDDDAPSFRKLFLDLARVTGGLSGPNETITQELAPLRFTAAHVCAAAMVNHSLLNNICTKYPLIFCTDQTGKGRARQYCLVDVYQVALLSECASLGLPHMATCEALNALLFPALYEAAELKVTWPIIADLPETSIAREKLRDDPMTHLPLYYRARYPLPWFLFSQGDQNPLAPRFHCCEAGSDVFAAIMSKAIIVNVSAVLARVDAALWRLVVPSSESE